MCYIALWTLSHFVYKLVELYILVKKKILITAVSSKIATHICKIEYMLSNNR